MRYTSEVITIAYSGDLAPLYYHALSLEKFWTSQKQWTIVVEDRIEHQHVVNWINEHIAPIMTGWILNIKVGKPIAATDGWHRQQVFKLLAASESTADYSVILDCKNFLIRNLGLDDFFNDGKLKVNIFTRSSPAEIDPTHIESCRILGVENASEIFPITPFVWRNNIVRELLNKLDSVNYDISIQPIIKASEAALYWVFAQTNELWTETKENWAFGQYGGLTKNDRLTKQQLVEQFDRADDENAHIITMHRFHTTPEYADLLGEYLRTKGLVGDWKINFFRETFKKCLYRMRPAVIEILHKEWNMSPLPLKFIKRNQRDIAFNRIVAYGCSHTAGSELADHLFWHEPITAVELDKIKRGYNDNRTDFYNKNPRLCSLEAIGVQSQLSWAAQVAKRLDVDFLNKGLSGGSMQSIVYLIERDFADGVISENDLILVGATSMDRWMYFSEEERFGWPHAATPIIGYPGLWPTEKFHNDFVEHVADDYFTLYNYFNTLKYLDLLSSNFNGRILVQPLHQTVNDYIRFVSSKSLNKRFIGMIESINKFSSIIDHNVCFGNLVDWQNESQVHGFNHPHIKYHEQLADIIVGRLLNNE
jgi:hypothetical protein